MIGYASMSYCHAGSLKMEFVLESWSNAVIYSANSISACEGCRTDRNSRPGYSIRCMCNIITVRAVDMVQITAGQDVTISSGVEIQTRLLRMKLCHVDASIRSDRRINSDLRRSVTKKFLLVMRTELSTTNGITTTIVHPGYQRKSQRIKNLAI
jgi:hypothetical protein